MLFPGYLPLLNIILFNQHFQGISLIISRNNPFFDKILNIVLSL